MYIRPKLESTIWAKTGMWLLVSPPTKIKKIIRFQKWRKSAKGKKKKKRIDNREQSYNLEPFTFAKRSRLTTSQNTPVEWQREKIFFCLFKALTPAKLNICPQEVPALTR